MISNDTHINQNFLTEKGAVGALLIFSGVCFLAMISVYFSAGAHPIVSYVLGGGMGSLALLGAWEKRHAQTVINLIGYLLPLVLVLLVIKNGIVPMAFTPLLAVMALAGMSRVNGIVVAVVLTAIPMAYFVVNPAEMQPVAMRMLVTSVAIPLLFYFVLNRLRHSVIDKEAINKQLLIASDAKTDFLANMSHEIRTPLNGMFGSLQIIQQNKSDPAMVEKYTDVAMNSYQSVIGVVNDILDLTKITEGKVVLYPEPARIGSLLGAITSDFAASAQQKGIKLDAQIGPRLSESVRLIDALRFGQVVRNVLSNAIKFTDQGRVSLYADVGNTADQVILTIKDTGVGILLDKLDTIFEYFGQAEASRVTERRGTGLGLPIAKRLTELMGGMISVSSVLNEGSTFTLTLDLPLTHKKIKDEIEEKITELKPARILLAEDVKTNQMVFEVMLRNDPYEIDIAVNGEDAVMMAHANNYDVIFMDIMMPKMDGLEALEALKVAGYQKPVIACTANVMKEDVERYLAAGFDGVIGKPYLLDELHMHIQSAVSSVDKASSVNARA